MTSASYWLVDSHRFSVESHSFTLWTLLSYSVSSTHRRAHIHTPETSSFQTALNIFRLHVQFAVAEPTRRPVFQPPKMAKVGFISMSPQQQNQIKRCFRQHLNTTQTVSQHTIETQRKKRNMPTFILAIARPDNNSGIIRKWHQTFSKHWKKKKPHFFLFRFSILQFQRAKDSNLHSHIPHIPPAQRLLLLYKFQVMVVLVI